MGNINFGCTKIIDYLKSGHGNPVSLPDYFGVGTRHCRLLYINFGCTKIIDYPKSGDGSAVSLQYYFGVGTRQCRVLPWLDRSFCYNTPTAKSSAASFSFNSSSFCQTSCINSSNPTRLTAEIDKTGAPLTS